MKICRFDFSGQGPHVGLIQNENVIDLSDAGVGSVTLLLEDAAARAQLQDFSKSRLPKMPLANVKLLAPVERQEVWAAGVTYLRSKKARMEESDFSASAYDRVYEAARPELFFKSLPEKVAATGGMVGIRKDAKWNVPEPELALVLNSKRELVGYTIGNDMSSRDIEGENTLYLPQAKVYKNSCALGPCIALGDTEEQARSWKISIGIERAGQKVFAGETSVGQIKRGFAELAEFLFRSQEFPQGAILLTGTGVVPPDDFTLAAGDVVQIEISGIGVLRNEVAVV